MGSAVSLRLPLEIRERLEKLSRRTGRSKSFYMIQAIVEKLDDIEDAYEADAAAGRIRAGKEKTYPLEEVTRELGLDD